MMRHAETRPAADTSSRSPVIVRLPRSVRRWSDYRAWIGPRRWVHRRRIRLGCATHPFADSVELTGTQCCGRFRLPLTRVVLPSASPGVAGSRSVVG